MVIVFNRENGLVVHLQNAFHFDALRHSNEFYHFLVLCSLLRYYYDTKFKCFMLSEHERLNTFHYVILIDNNSLKKKHLQETRTLTSAKMMSSIAAAAAASSTSSETIIKMMKTATATIILTMIQIYLGIAIIGMYGIILNLYFLCILVIENARNFLLVFSF